MEIRVRGSSGGVVTAILTYLIETSAVDGAIVTCPVEENPLRPAMQVCHSVDDVRRAATSRYCPVEINQALRAAISSEKSYAVVGLPCHINSLVKARHQLVHLKKTFPVLLGLLCGHTPSFLATDYVLETLGVSVGDIESVKYRGDGWPGGMRIDTRDGRSRSCPHEELWRGPLGMFFFPAYCLQCADHLNIQADVSFGDAWLSTTVPAEGGCSVMVARTELGRQIVRNASGSHIIVEQVERSTIIESQDGFRFAMNQPSRSLARRLFGRPIVQHYAIAAYKGWSIPQALSGLALDALSRLSTVRCMWPLVRVLLRLRRVVRG